MMTGGAHKLFAGVLVCHSLPLPCRYDLELDSLSVTLSNLYAAVRLAAVYAYVGGGHVW